jgi:catechol 2,3-dioxygenase-like lactoylglutathione lyase family enzyme
MLTHVQIVSVPVTDQDAAHEFYVDRLGLTVVADLEGGPHDRWLQVAPGSGGPGTTTLALMPAVDGARLTGLVFETDDIEAEVARLVDRGVAVPDGVEDMPWARAARFEDPDGNQLVLQTAPAMVR